MNIHEYQAKALLSRYHVATPVGYPALSEAEAKEAIAKLKGPVWVIKAQIHAGGRGLGGGVKLAKSPEEALDWYKKIMGMQLVTHQTGPEGKKVERVYIEDGSAIARELYLGMLIDRSTYRVTIIASTEGGMDIEHVAEKTPEKIMTLSVDPVTGLLPFHGRRVAFGLGLTGSAAKECVTFLETMYRAFIDTDASMLEINPLVVTKDDKLVALDAKMNFDDNALFRHPDVFALRDETEEDPAEIEATAHSLNYVKLDGDIGCMVNGAGLAMATMDIIKLYGSSPANFLDVGGGATKERVTAAFKIILRDPNVKAILVNIFGGIMRCDIIAEGVIAAAREINLHVPLVVRLEGTNVDLGKKIMAESGLPIISADNLADAAAKVVATLKQ